MFQASVLDSAVTFPTGPTQGTQYRGGASRRKLHVSFFLLVTFTRFWIDPQKELVAIIMTNAFPSSAGPLREKMQQMIYPSVVD
ncbi:MAG: CubicO group peptidase (beta-lactamase class C family) [Candidatus Paceibacteria bacterium]|jgi:CubicO group peptidase (beta-lactamase class C family)